MTILKVEVWPEERRKGETKRKSSPRAEPVWSPCPELTEARQLSNEAEAPVFSFSFECYPKNGGQDRVHGGIAWRAIAVVASLQQAVRSCTVGDVVSGSHFPST